MDTLCPVESGPGTYLNLFFTLLNLYFFIFLGLLFQWNSRITTVDGVISPFETRETTFLSSFLKKESTQHG